jgi:PAS domain-containing protein
MKGLDPVFVLLHLSVLITLSILFYIARIERKKQIHYVFFTNMVLMLIWCFAVLLRDYMHYFYDSDGKTLMLVSYFGVCYAPLTLMCTGILFARTRIKITAKHLLLLFPPTLSYLILLTNDYHQLFYIRYSFDESQIVYGKYFPIHSMFMYAYVLIGLYYLIFFSIKNSGVFSKQSLVIVLGTSFPLAVNILYSFKIVELSAAATPVSFTFAAICYIFAIQKYDFLNIVPIAMSRVVDLISDGFVVINEEMKIVDYNKTFTEIFKEILHVNRNINFIDAITSENLEGIDAELFEKYIETAKENKKTFSFENNIRSGSFNKYFTIETTPIQSQLVFQP